MTPDGPPSAETRLSPFAVPKRIVPPPAGLHAPPEKSFASVRSFTAPPAASTFFSLPAITNAMNLLSGDQNGCAALSVPATLRDVTAPVGANVERRGHRRIRLGDERNPTAVRRDADVGCVQTDDRVAELQGLRIGWAAQGKRSPAPRARRRRPAGSRARPSPRGRACAPRRRPPARCSSRCGSG